MEYERRYVLKYRKNIYSQNSTMDIIISNSNQNEWGIEGNKDQNIEFLTCCTNSRKLWGREDGFVGFGLKNIFLFYLNKY